MIVKIKSKAHCILWCLRNGLIKPSKYYLTRFGKHKEGRHNYFSYDKFERCGKIFKAEKCIGLKDYYECFGYQFHKDLVDIVQ